MKTVVAEKEVVKEVIKELCSALAAEVSHVKTIILSHQENLPIKEKTILINSLTDYISLAKRVHLYSKQIDKSLAENDDRLEILTLCHKILVSIQFFRDDLASLSTFLQTGKFPSIDKNTLH